MNRVCKEKVTKNVSFAKYVTGQKGRLSPYGPFAANGHMV